MRHFVKGVLRGYWQPQFQAFRLKSHVNVTRPRPSHFQRSVIESVCKPYFSKERKRPKCIPDYDTCNVFKQEKTEQSHHPFEIILAREAKNWLDNSKMIAFFHKNYVNSEDLFQYKFLLKNNGMKILNYGKKVMQIAITGSVYEPVLVLYQSHTVMVVSTDPEIHKLLNLSKKMPRFILMAAVVENKFLSVSELQHYSKLSNVETARAQFVGILNSVSQGLVQNISHHPNSVVQVLSHHQDLSKTKSQK